MTPEVLQTGLLVFALGMGMVFAVLFVIFVVLKIMGFVAVSITKKAKPAPAPAVAAAPVPVAAAPAPASNDSEIAAVISAAIAAYCAGEPGANPSRLKVRSIRRATKWDGSK